MHKELKEYSEAYNEHLKAKKARYDADLYVLKTRNRLMKAKEELSAREKELLEETNIQNHASKD